MAALVAAGGCGAISVSPSCPAGASPGETIQISGGVNNPGATPRYLWEAVPASAGTFADAEAPDTSFTVASGAEGDIVLRLSAADGLFLSVGTCTVRVEGASVQVELTIAPASGRVGDSFTLACGDVGTSPAASFTISSVSGPSAVLTPILAGGEEFIPAESGTYVFECIGTDSGGTVSLPSRVTVEVTSTPSRPGR